MNAHETAGQAGDPIIIHKKTTLKFRPAKKEEEKKEKGLLQKIKDLPSETSLVLGAVLVLAGQAMIAFSPTQQISSAARGKVQAAVTSGPNTSESSEIKAPSQAKFEVCWPLPEQQACADSLHKVLAIGGEQCCKTE